MKWIYNYDEQKGDLAEIHFMLSENKCLDKVLLFFGTLLGAIRQGKLNTSINDWDDIDFAFCEKDFEVMKKIVFPNLIKMGFHIENTHWTPENQFAHTTFIKKQNRIDFVQLFPIQNYHVHWLQAGNILLKKGMASDYADNIKKIPLEGLEFYGPKNSENYLIDMYGKAWKIPCTSEFEYDYTSDFPGVPWWSRISYIKTSKGWEI